jgi:ATP-dependent DNA helicase RecQ
MAVNADTHELDRHLNELFGLEEFRPGQREVIESILGGKDVLCVMPTGGGKSLCYQLPALIRPGLTLVISPLIALMKDQVDALQGRGIRATLINSTLDLDEQNARLAEIELGRYDLAYIAPERFRSKRFVEAMARVRPSLLAVDEAHCISEWGHDFRPDYTRIGLARQALGMPQCVALTATATDLVRRDITKQLDLQDVSQFVTGFDRPNLTYRAADARKDQEKFQILGDALERNPGPAIVYASSRKRCEEVATWVARTLRREAVVYHAGLGREERDHAQNQFMNGHVDVVVATNAFGMGVDKSNIRSVVHFNMPGTLEAYYPVAGRAGRDGLPADCTLIHAPGDRFLQEMFIENEYPSRAAVYLIYDFLRRLKDDPIELTQAQIREQSGTDLHESAIGTAIGLLEKAGALERFSPRENQAIVRINLEPDGDSLLGKLGPQAHVQRNVLAALEAIVNRRFGEPVYFSPEDLSARLGMERAAFTRAMRALSAELPIDYVPPFRGNAIHVLDRDRRMGTLGIDFEALDARRSQEYEKLDRMIQYAQSKTCRRAYILRYFGDKHAQECGRCDRCHPGGPVAAASSLTTIDTPAGSETLRKILSGVARAKGRFGKVLIAQMLLGAGNERMEKTGLDRLTTFGILAKSGFTQRELTEIIDALLRADFLESEDVDRFRPVLRLNAPGLSWLKTEPADASFVALELPEYLAAKLRNGGLERVVPASSASSSTLDEALGLDPRESPPSGLEERLIALRKALAKREGLTPAYIFSNETLNCLIRDRPATPQALVMVKGIGPAKLERFGVDLLAVLRSESEPVPQTVIPAAAPTPRPTEPIASRSAVELSASEWTRRLIERGFTIDEAAAIRRLPKETILRHLAESGGGAADRNGTG